MARCSHGGQHEIAEPDLLTVMNDSADRNGWERLHDSELRVVRRRASGREDLCPRFRACHRGAAQVLEPGDAADMVEMFVAIENEPDVLDPEAELADGVSDEVGVFHDGAVDTDV